MGGGGGPGGGGGGGAGIFFSPLYSICTGRRTLEDRKHKHTLNEIERQLYRRISLQLSGVLETVSGCPHVAMTSFRPCSGRSSSTSFTCGVGRGLVSPEVALIDTDCLLFRLLFAFSDCAEVTQNTMNFSLGGQYILSTMISGHSSSFHFL